MSQRDDRPHQAMGPGAEFDTIRLLMARWGDLAVDIGDDAAVLAPVGDRRIVVSTDACIEGAHFRRRWLSPFEIGVRAAAAAISDIAAMGARADAILLALVVPDDWCGALVDIADGIAHVVRASSARIVGGNLSRGDVLGITTTVIGSTTRPISRRGARPGDVLVVTGTLGGPGSAVAAWEAGQSPESWARGRFASPVPRLAEGAALADAGAHAMLDLSDGLVADARHLAAASGVRLIIDAARIPVGDGIGRDAALRSGEEYELLAALAPDAAASLLRSWRERFRVPLTMIGRVGEADPSGTVVVNGLTDGAAIENSGTARVEFISGHDHFSQ